MQVLILGPTSAPLFSEVVSSLRSFLSANEVPAIELTERHSISDIATTPPADLVLVLQQWPDEFTRADVLSLIGRQPLARMIVCYGPWCDSDGRTRDVWPHAVRVSITQAADRLTHELEDLRRGGQPLPLTASRDETFGWNHQTGPQTTTNRRLVSVISADRALRDWLQDVFEQAGDSIAESVTPSTDLIVWDADPWGAASRERLLELQQCLPGVPIVVVCGFPRTHEVSELLDAGTTLVLPKFMHNDRFIACLEDIAGQSPSSTTQPTANVRVYEAG